MVVAVMMVGGRVISPPDYRACIDAKADYGRRIAGGRVDARAVPVSWDARGIDTDAWLDVDVRVRYDGMTTVVVMTAVVMTAGMLRGSLAGSHEQADRQGRAKDEVLHRKLRRGRGVPRERGRTVRMARRASLAAHQTRRRPQLALAGVDKRPWAASSAFRSVAAVAGPSRSFGRRDGCGGCDERRGPLVFQQEAGEFGRGFPRLSQGANIFCSRVEE